jgi:RNA-binding protein
MMTELTGSQKRNLRSIGRHLQPSLTLGKGGIADGAVETLRLHLRSGGLVKVRLSPGPARQRHDQAEDLAQRAEALCVDLVGRSALIYRPGPEDPLQQG